MPQVRQVGDLARGDLEPARAELGQQIETGNVEGGGKKADPALLAMCNQLVMHFARQLETAQHGVL